MSEKTRIKVNISGYDLAITSDEGEDYLRALAQRTDDRISRLMSYSNTMSTTTAALFTALEFCDEVEKEKDVSDNLRAQIKDYLEDAVKSKAEITELHRREQELTRQLHEARRLQQGRGNA